MLTHTCTSPLARPRRQLPRYVAARPRLLEKFKAWECKEYGQEGGAAPPAPAPAAGRPAAPGPRATRSSAPPDPGKLSVREAWEFMKDEKGWDYHKPYGFVVAPEDGAEPVEQMRVSRRC